MFARDGRYFQSKALPSADELRATWAAVDAARRTSEAIVEQAMLDVLNRMADETVRRYEVLSGTKAAGPAIEIATDLIFDELFWRQVIAEALGPAAAEAMIRGFKSGSIRIGYSGQFQPQSPAVLRTIRAINDKSVSIPSSARDIIDSIIVNSTAEGASIDQIAARISSRLHEDAVHRARMIAQTSGRGAYEAGQVESYKDFDVSHHSWLTAGDGKERDSHLFQNMVQVPVGDPFPNGLLYPADPMGEAAEVINCRCTTLPSPGGATEPT